MENKERISSFDKFKNRATTIAAMISLFSVLTGCVTVHKPVWYESSSAKSVHEPSKWPFEESNRTTDFSDSVDEEKKDDFWQKQRQAAKEDLQNAQTYQERREILEYIQKLDQFIAWKHSASDSHRLSIEYLESAPSKIHFEIVWWQIERKRLSGRLFSPGTWWTKQEKRDLYEDKQRSWVLKKEKSQKWQIVFGSSSRHTQKDIFFHYDGHTLYIKLDEEVRRIPIVEANNWKVNELNFDSDAYLQIKTQRRR